MIVAAAQAIRPLCHVGQVEVRAQRRLMVARLLGDTQRAQQQGTSLLRTAVGQRYQPLRVQRVRQRRPLPQLLGDIDGPLQRLDRPVSRESANASRS